MHVPLTCLEGIWRKANELLWHKNAIVPAPGNSTEARMVKGYSGKVLHMVTPTKGGSGFSCNLSCPNWKSIGFCAHSITVAELNGKLSPYYIAFHFEKKKKSPNVTKLGTSDMSQGRGRKGSVIPQHHRAQLTPETRMPMPHFNAIGTPSVSAPQTSSQYYSPSVSIPQTSSQYYSPSGFHPQGVQYPYQSLPFPNMFQLPDMFVPPNPFKLCFIKGNISTCIGCNNKYPKLRQEPNDLCIKHQEWRQFTPQGTDIVQTKFANVYYHCNPGCVWIRCLDFVPEQLDLDEVEGKLSPILKHISPQRLVYLMTNK